MRTQANTALQWAGEGRSVGKERVIGSDIQIISLLHTDRKGRSVGGKGDAIRETPAVQGFYLEYSNPPEASRSLVV